MATVEQWAKWPRLDFDRCLWCTNWKKHTLVQHMESVAKEDELRDWRVS